MKKPLWFKAKNYGYGWYPATWQGWLILFFFVGTMIANVIRLKNSTQSISDFLINLIPETIILALLLIYICTLTGEPAEWRWGPKSSHKNHHTK